MRDPMITPIRRNLSLPARGTHANHVYAVLGERPVSKTV